jgi:hypothetical protein
VLGHRRGYRRRAKLLNVNFVAPGCGRLLVASGGWQRRIERGSNGDRGLMAQRKLPWPRLSQCDAVADALK